MFQYIYIHHIYISHKFILSVESAGGAFRLLAPLPLPALPALPAQRGRRAPHLRRRAEEDALRRRGRPGPFRGWG